MKPTDADRIQLKSGMGHHPGRRPSLPDAPRVSTTFATPAHAVIGRAEATPDDVAYIFATLDGKTAPCTYGELLTHAQRYAAAFAEAGVEQGDRVLICLDTDVRAVAAFYGCSLLGAAPVMLSLPLGAANIPSWSLKVADAVGTLDARAVLVDSAVALAAREPVARHPNCRLLTPHKLPEARPFAPPPADDEGLAYVQFTSGTTAIPKAVYISNRALRANMSGITGTGRWVADDLAVIWLPLFHDMGLVSGMLAPLMYGIPSVLMSPLAFVFTPSRWLWALHYFRGTLTAAPNFAYHICAHRLSAAETEGLDVSNWRLAHNGAEFIHADTVDAFQARFGPHGFRREAMYPVYGMAECVLAATFPEVDEGPFFDLIDLDALMGEGIARPATPDTARPTRVVAVGRPFPGHAVRVVDDEGQLVPDRVQGRIQLFGPSVTPGYFRDERASRKLLLDGWLETGDLGYLADGRLYVYGRRKDIIIKAGRNYQPDGMEKAAAQVDGVREGCVAAFGVLNQDTGTEDLVVVFESRREAPGEVDRMTRQVSAAIKREVGLAPNRIVAVKARSLPKTTSGKLKRAAVRRLLISGGLDVIQGSR